MADFFYQYEGIIIPALKTLAILLAGWILARWLKKISLLLLQRTDIDNWAARMMGHEDEVILNTQIAAWVSRLTKLGALYYAGKFLYSIPEIAALAQAALEWSKLFSQNAVVVFIFDLILLYFSTVIYGRLRVVLENIFDGMKIRIEGWRKTQIKAIKIQRLELLTADRMTDGLLLLNQYLRYAMRVVLFLVYLTVVFSFFPQTRGIVSEVVNRVMASVASGWQGFVAYLPNLINLAMIYFAIRYLLRFLHFMAREIGKGEITITGFYPEWAEPTFQLVRILLIALAVVIAFPYLPGSASPAFQGLSLFFGFLFSLGSSSVVANIIAGIVLTYTRAFKVGDRVRISDTEGDVMERTLFVTRVRTIKNVEITIPNGQVLGSHIINYSSSSQKESLILHTTVTIGYDVSWRLMHEVLIKAALATPDVLPEPAPFVYQTSLDDYYVSYQINAHTKNPWAMARIYSQLHENIQDQCGQAGIEILSPGYEVWRDDPQHILRQSKTLKKGKK